MRETKMPISSNFEQLLKEVFQGNEETLNELLLLLTKPLLPSQINLLHSEVDQTLNEDPENLAALYLKAHLAQRGLGCGIDYEKAHVNYKLAISKGHIRAIVALALMYLSIDKPKDAIPLLDLAVKHGHVDAIFERALIYEKGAPEDQNHAEALLLYQKASEAGHFRATYRLGRLFQMGRGVAVDYAEAIRLYKKAAEQDYHEAIYELGYMHVYGQGVPPNITQGLVYIEKALSLGNCHAYLARGMLFQEGLGSPVNYLAAAKLYRQVLEVAPEQAKTYLTSLKENTRSHSRNKKKIDELSYSISVGFRDNLWQKDPENYLIFLVKDDLLSSDQKVSILVSMLNAFPNLTATYRSSSNGKVPSFFAEAERLVSKQQSLAQQKLSIISGNDSYEETTDEPRSQRTKLILSAVAPKVRMAFKKIDSQLTPKRWHHNKLCFLPGRQQTDTFTINSFLKTIEVEGLEKKEFFSLEEDRALAQKYIKLIKRILEKKVKDPYAQAAANVLSGVLQELGCFADIIKPNLTTYSAPYH